MDLYTFRAGRNGPIDIQHSFKAMCTPSCLESDALHESLMKYTGCNCLELSFSKSDPLYVSPGNFCLENTGRILCDMIGFCGIWDCRLGDFMCPRYEWNKKIIPLKGKRGSCLKVSSAQKGISFLKSFQIALVMTMVSILILRM